MFSCFSHVQLFATPWTVACQALSMRILQARILEWVAMPFSRGSSQPRNQTGVSCIVGGFFTSPIREAWISTMEENVKIEYVYTYR